MERVKRITKAEEKKFVKDATSTKDSFTNFLNRLGMGTDNQLTNSQYSLNNMISRNRVELEAAYRSSWLVGQIVDCIAEDMTKTGITIDSTMEPDDIQEIQSVFSELGLWQQICDVIKWSRLYGGALGVYVIDGADYSKSFKVDSVGKDSFKGLLVLDRWMVMPTLGDLVTEIGKDLGMPKYYEVISSITGMPMVKIHHSRVMRFDGIRLPYYQKMYENLWGLSVVERLLDRLLAFDSATLGAAQLVYKCYLRTVKINGLREALATGGKDEAAVIKQFMYIRRMQNMEGITLLDKEDDFSTHQYSFSGISDLLMQFGMQLSGGSGIPLVRLFGQSPAGLNSTGESDLRNYYDGIGKEQENKLRPHLTTLLEIISRSRLGKELPKGFNCSFNSLYKLNDKEKSEIATNDINTISSAYGAGIITKKLAMQELKQSSNVSGKFSNITEEDIEAAEEEVPEPEIMGVPEPQEEEGLENEEELSDEELFGLTGLEEPEDIGSEEENLDSEGFKDGVVG